MGVVPIVLIGNLLNLFEWGITLKHALEETEAVGTRNVPPEVQRPHPDRSMRSLATGRHQQLVKQPLTWKKAGARKTPKSRTQLSIRSISFALKAHG